MPIALAVHGGAWNIPDEFVQPSLDGVRAATERGWEMLRDGASSLDVVEAVVRILEDDPHFDAAVGSRVNREGKVEMDASIMEGDQLRAGAVAAIQDVRHPVSVARKVMEETSHVMLVGSGARRFAEEVGAELCDTSDLLIGRELERFERVRAGETDLVDHEFGPPSEAEPKEEQPMGTVGCVAMDTCGLLAAATSTGGIQDKLPGRVGDTPVIGAGTYADNRIGAASATGWGEGILRVSLAKTAVDLMGTGRPPRHAGLQALETLDHVRGKAGLILIDPEGNPGVVFNTPRMSRGWATERDGVFAAVERTDPLL